MSAVAQTAPPRVALAKPRGERKPPSAHHDEVLARARAPHCAGPLPTTADTRSSGTARPPASTSLLYGQMAACARPLAWTGECAAARATPLRTPVVSRWVAAHCVRRAGHPHCKPAPGCGCRTSPVVAHARGERAQRYDARRSHSSAPPACVISNPHIWQASWLSDADTCVNS